MNQDPQARSPEPRNSLPALIESLEQAASLADLIEKIPSRVASYLGCRRVLLYEVRDEALHMVSGTADATTQGWSSTLLRIASIHPIPLNDAQPEARALGGDMPLVEPGTPDTPMRVIAPMHSLGGPIGVLVVIPSEGEAAWGADGLRVSQMLLLGLRDVARAVGLVLECARLLTENHQRAEEMDTLTRLTSAFNTSLLDLEAAIGIVERQVSRIIKVDRCTVALGPTTAARLPTLSSRWLRVELLRGIMQMRAPVLLDDISVWPLASMLPEGVKSFYAFPLVADDRVVGVLALAFHTPHTLDPGERDLLSVLANTASTVLQKARLLAEAERARQQARSTLEHAQREERLKDAILRTIPSGIMTVDLEGRVTLLNHQAANLLGWDSQAIGRPVEEIMPILGGGPHLVRARLGPHLGTRNREVRVRTAANRDLTLSVSLSPLRMPDGKEIGVLCAFQDMTLLRNAEEEIRRLDSVSNMGKEADEIIHDMFGMINGVSLGIQTVIGAMGDSEEEKLTANHILKELNRLTSLAENLKYLGKPKAPTPQPIDASDLIDRILRLLAPRAEMSRVTFERHFEPGATLLADEDMVARAIQNLCGNAIEAMPKGGKLTITARTTRAPLPVAETVGAGVAEARLVASAPAATVARPPSTPAATNKETALLLPDNSGHAVEIEIADTGKGISAENLPSIWEPFKTFDKRNGTGLGLAIVRQVVEAHGGSFSVQSEVNRGTTFTLRLPSAR